MRGTLLCARLAQQWRHMSGLQESANEETKSASLTGRVCYFCESTMVVCLDSVLVAWFQV